MAVKSFGRATKWAALENQSINVRIVVLPAEGGSPVMKSRDVGPRSARLGKRLK